MDIIGQTFEINGPDVVGEILDGEAIVLHLKRGYYYSLEGTGALIWGGIERRLPATYIADALASYFGLSTSDARAAIQKLLTELLSHELVRPSHHPGQDSDLAWPAADDRQYAEPRLQVFTDMQDLILLDPIHEVGDAGWPVAPASKS